MCHINT